MTLAATARGTAADTLPNISISPSGDFAASSIAVLVIGGDNAGWASAMLNSVSDSIGNTWVVQQAGTSNSGGGYVSCELYIATCIQDVAALTTAASISATTFLTTGQVQVALWEVTASAGTPTYKAGGMSVEQTGTSTPSITSGSIGSGNLIIGACAHEDGRAGWTADSDTTNGNWSSAQQRSGGSFSTGTGIITQWKTVTSAGTQTYNVVTPTTAESFIGWIEIEEVIAAAARAFSNAFIIA